MTRVKKGKTKRKRHKKVLKMAKGYWGQRHRQFKVAREAVMHALQYAYRDRRQRKRDMRALWIARINAAARLNGLTYNRFIDGLNKAGVAINRKMLSELAVKDPEAFSKLTELAKEPLKG